MEVAEAEVGSEVAEAEVVEVAVAVEVAMTVKGAMTVKLAMTVKVSSAKKVTMATSLVLCGISTRPRHRLRMKMKTTLLPTDRSINLKLLSLYIFAGRKEN